MLHVDEDSPRGPIIPPEYPDAARDCAGQRAVGGAIPAISTAWLGKDNNYWKAQFLVELSHDCIRTLLGCYQGAAAAVHGPNYARLRDVKAKYDPANFFHTNLNITPP